MKFVLDTNDHIAGFISHGACNELVEYCAINHEVVLSMFILREFKQKLIHKFGFTAHEAESAVNLLESRFEVVTPLALTNPICRDVDDDQVIGTALAGKCEFIVTGDKDLLDLQCVRQIRMISPSCFWALEK